MKSSIKIFGLNALGILKNDDSILINSGRIETTKRLAICNNKPMVPVQHNAKIGGILKIGERQPGDFLLHLQKVIVQPKYMKRFSRHHFEFSDDNISISEVTITASVSRIFAYYSFLCNYYLNKH